MLLWRDMQIVDFQMLIATVISFLPKLFAALVVLVATLLIANLAAKWVSNKSVSRGMKAETARLLGNVVRWAILIPGFIVALEQVDFNVTGFLAGLGVAGFTIGFALQDISKNFISGILILLRQPFRIGDAVELSGYEGKVTDITLRDTVVQTWDGEVVILPNATVYAEPIKNFSGLQHRRRTLSLGVGYDVDLKTARERILETVKLVEGVSAEPEPMVMAKEFGASAIVLNVYYWVDQRQYSLLKVPSDVIQAIKEMAEQEGIHIPYPIQTVKVSISDSDKKRLSQ